MTSFIVKILPLLLLVLCSCTETIDITTNSSDSQIVVEGGIASGEYAKVHITKSIDLNQNNSFPVVTNATVTISNESGDSEILTETAPGTYQSTHLKGRQGETYYLKVAADNKEITSTSVMPQKVVIDSFSVLNSPSVGRGSIMGSSSNNFYLISLLYTDPSNETNFYRMIVSVNHSVVDGNHVFSDEFNNGKKITTNLVMYNEKIKKGDTISVEFQNIEKNVFDYFSSISGGRMASSPANPNTNLNGAVLGYFSAYTSETKEYVVE